jgi:ubiquinone biosynthesis protein
LVPEHLIPTQLIPPSERAPVPRHRKSVVNLRIPRVIITLLSTGIAIFFLSFGGKSTRTRRRTLLKTRLEELGMLWIRVAQTLVVRSPRLASSLGEDILDLHDSGRAHDFADIRAIIESDLGRSLDSLFSHFEEAPFAATTISQIHSATLRDGGFQVAVKVQQPEAEDLFTRDLTLIRALFRWFRFFRIQRGMRWEDLYHELHAMVTRELNYYYEANTLERLLENLEGQSLYVPKVFRRESGKKVLVMEFIRGALLSDFQTFMQKDPERLARWLAENSIHPDKSAPRVFANGYRQHFEDNLFHGDMSPRNILLLRDGNLAVIDCRSAGSLEGESLMKQKLFMRSLAEGEQATAAEIYFLLATRLPRVNLGIVKEHLVRNWRVWEQRAHVEDLPYRDKSLSWMMGQMNRIINQHGFAAQWSFSKMSVALLHLDRVLALLEPRWDYHRFLRVYFQRESERETFRKLRNLPKRATASLVALHEMPKRMAEYTLFQESLVRRQAQVVQGSASKVDAIIAALFSFFSFLTIIAFFLTGAGTMHYHAAVNMEPWLGTQMTRWFDHLPQGSLLHWLLAMIFIVVLFLVLRGQQKRFRQGEFGGGGKAPLTF